MKTLITGGGGFIGGHLIPTFVRAGALTKSIDVKPLADWYQVHDEAENEVLDLRDYEACRQAVRDADVVINLAADMGGMGFIELNKAACMTSVLINTNLLRASVESGVSQFFFASSACVYSAEKQKQPIREGLREEDIYPIAPEDGYGWEKLFSERMCRHYADDYGLKVSVGRFHNVYGPHGTFEGGREKVIAALCRKVAEATLKGIDFIEVWGDGKQTRSFTYITDAIEGVRRLMGSGYAEPLNIGSDETVSIDELLKVILDVSGAKLEPRHLRDAPLGVRGRSSDNTRISQILGWKPSVPLRDGIAETYEWIFKQISSR
jgi:nucleoside-diphosphate-sugar epimerase